MARAPRDKPAPAQSGSRSRRCPRSQATRQVRQLRGGVPGTGARGGGTRDNHHVDVRGELKGALSTSLAHHPLDSIPCHGVAHLAGHSDTKPGRRRHDRSFQILPPPDEEKKVLAAHATTTSLHFQKIAALAQASTAREIQARPTIAVSHRVPGHPQRGTLLLRDGDGQLTASLATATSQDLPASGCLHPFAEPVGSQAALTMGLKRPFHD